MKIFYFAVGIQDILPFRIMFQTKKSNEYLNKQNFSRHSICHQNNDIFSFSKIKIRINVKHMKYKTWVLYVKLQSHFKARSSLPNQKIIEAKTTVFNNFGPKFCFAQNFLKDGPTKI